MSRENTIHMHGSTTRKHKCARLDREQDVTAGGPSQLCDLSNEILLHILAFLPMKDAVRTSILSKRWVHLWTSMPDLRFDDIVEFIDQALLLHDPQCAIKSFSLKSQQAENKVSRINTWITTAVRFKVQELNLDLCNFEESKPYVLPCSIFTCQTLVNLDLKLLYGYILRVPSSFQLPSLKVLHVSELKFADNESAERLFSCPLLEVLSIMSCHCENITDLRISAPKLRHLTIDERDDSHQYRVLINGDNLETFDYEGCLWNKYYVIGTCTKLITVRISVYYVRMDWDHVPDCVSKLLHVLSSTKNLSLSCEFLRAIVRVDDEHLDSLPMFYNLTHLALARNYITFDSTMLTIFTKFPHLRSLEFCLKPKDKYISYPIRDGGDDLEDVPSCFSFYLKKIILREYGASSGDIHTIGVLFKNAMVLEEMILECISGLKVFHMEKLRLLPRGSEKCRISVVF